MRSLINGIIAGALCFVALFAILYLIFVISNMQLSYMWSDGKSGIFIFLSLIVIIVSILFGDYIKTETDKNKI